MVLSFARPVRFAVCAAVCLLAGCGDDPTRPPPHEPPPLPAWSEFTSLPASFTTYALWAPAPDYVIAVGPRGLVHRWDGQRWAPIETETGKDLFAVTGDPTGPIVAVGDDGVALRFSSTRFIVVPTLTTEHLRGAWMAARDDFFVVGNAGTVLRGDGSTWNAQASGTSRALFSVWGSADDDVFAAGIDGTIIHFDGAAWTEMESGTTEILAAIHGAGHGDVYAVGDRGTILHYDGAAWSPMNSGTTALLQSVWAGGTPVAVGANGTILARADGGAWEAHTGIADTWLYAVTRAGDRAWIAGTNTVLAHDGNAWQAPTRGAVPVLRAVAAESAGNGILIGGDEGYIAHGAAGRWHVEDASGARTFRDLWESDDGDLFAVGTNRILRRSGAEWIIESAEIGEFNAIDGRDGLVFAVGSEGRIRVRTPSGWKGYGAITPLNLHGVAVLSGHEAYVVGENGWIAAFNGAAWQSVRSGTTADLFDVMAVQGPDRPKAVAVGDGGVIRALFDPLIGWSEMTSPTTVALHALAFGPGGDVYAVGGAGHVLRLDGTSWERVPAPTGRALHAACSRNGTLFVAGGDDVGGAVLLRYGPPQR